MSGKKTQRCEFWKGGDYWLGMLVSVYLRDKLQKGLYVHFPLVKLLLLRREGESSD